MKEAPALLLWVDAMRNRNDARRYSNTLTYLRMLFFCLAMVCLVQIVHDTRNIVPGFDSAIDNESLSHLRPRDAPSKDAQVRAERLPLMKIDPLYRNEQRRIDTGMDDAARCAQYGVPVLPEDQRNTKRIFFGSMLANENPEVIIAHAIEVYNKYDVIALVESNTTHSGAPRQMFFEPGSIDARLLTESAVFGEKSKVVIDYWLEDLPVLEDMAREVEQRNVIWKIWVEQGMTERDIGVMADLDEIVSRDFLNALKVCDFPETRYDPRPSCQEPKLVLSSIQFEGSPLCIKQDEWYHPDVILGNCILGVGDPTGRVTPEREESPPGSSAKTLGRRSEEWGIEDTNSYPKDIIENKRFPLWDGRDIREVSGFDGTLMNFAREKEMAEGKTAVFGTAYHLHNWFKDTQTLRHKYLTYGHSDKHAMTMPLSDFSGDVNMMVRCARGLGNEIKVKKEDDPNLFDYYENNHLLTEHDENVFSLGGNRPIYFMNRTYVQERHSLVQQVIAADEAKHGSIYN